MKDILTIEGNKFYYTDIFLSFIDEQITKHSPNIIDLVEVGDYVNGELVASVSEESVEIGEGWHVKAKNIKSIVTHQQFNSIKYEVE